MPTVATTRGVATGPRGQSGAPTIVMVAGELSGDRLGAGLIEAARTLRPDLRFAGVPGPRMRAAGCEAWFGSEDLAVMGLFEVVRHLPRLRRALRTAIAATQALRPAAYVGIDAPDFNLRVARAVRSAGTPTLQYVSPSVWAWRRGRVATIRAACSRVLCLLPFEAEFLAAEGVEAEFVGHPLADEIVENPDPVAARRALGAEPDRPTLALLPGSRAGEVGRLADLFLATADWVAARLPNLQCLLPAATPVLQQVLAERLRRHPPRCPVRVVAGRSLEVLAAADACLIASGTATLEALLVNRPMVIAYRLAMPTYAFLRLTGMIKVEHVGLPNLLAGRRLVPELLQHQATAPALGAAVVEVLTSEPLRAELRSRFHDLRGGLARDASARAARATLAAAGLL